MNERMKFDPAAAEQAGKIDGVKLFAAALNKQYENLSDDLLQECMSETIGLAAEHRIEEAQARIHGFCKFIGDRISRTLALEEKCALLSASLNQADHVAKITADEQRAIHAAISICNQVAAGRIIIAHPNDDDAIVTLAELQLAIRELEPKEPNCEH